MPTSRIVSVGLVVVLVEVVLVVAGVIPVAQVAQVTLVVQVVQVVQAALEVGTNGEYRKDNWYLCTTSRLCN